jgi:glycosyltransferase involved in cell wall biosynthesis
VHTHQSKAGLIGRLAARAVPDAVVVHGIHIVPFDNVGPVRRRLYLAGERLAARNTDLFIGVSKAVGQSYVDHGIAPAERVHCVRSGMDLTRFQTAGLPDDWRALLGLAPGEPRPGVVVMLAAFERRKRHVALLRALAAAGDTLPRFKLLFAGKGPEEARVRAEVAALGLQDRVVFCGHRSDPEALLALADLSVLTSEREGLPRVIVQSIAAGCPVLVNALPGVGEVVQDGRNGLIMPRDDLTGLVLRMCDLMANEHRLQRLRAGALETDVRDWSLSALGAQSTALYDLSTRPPQMLAQSA